MSISNKSIFLSYVMALSLFFLPAQGVVIKKECSPSFMLGYLKCGLAGGLGFSTISYACFLTYLATLDFDLNWLPASIKPEAQSMLSFIKHSIVTGGSFAVLSGAYATKIIYDSAQDNFEAIAQQERDTLMQELALEQQQQQQVQQLQIQQQLQQQVQQMQTQVLQPQVQQPQEQPQQELPLQKQNQEEQQQEQEQQEQLEQQVQQEEKQAAYA